MMDTKLFNRIGALWPPCRAQATVTYQPEVEHGLVDKILRTHYDRKQNVAITLIIHLDEVSLDPELDRGRDDDLMHPVVCIF